jgi:hypothetical protein
VNVRRQGTAEAEPVGAGLLLPDAPLQGGSILKFDDGTDEFGPLNARLDLDGSLLRIEAYDAVEAAHIDQHHVRTELLSAHRVAAAGHTERHPGLARHTDGPLDRFERRGAAYGLHPCPVQFGMNVVDPDAGPVGRTRAGERTRESDRIAGDGGLPKLLVDRHRALRLSVAVKIWRGGK